MWFMCHGFLSSKYQNLFLTYHAGIWLKPVYGMYVSYALITLFFMYICIFLQDELCLGLMDQLHTKTSTSSLQMGPTQVPPNSLINHKLQKVLCPQPTGLLLRVKSKAPSVIRVTTL